jgi:2-dehydro-3-deoxygluconokinase
VAYDCALPSKAREGIDEKGLQMDILGIGECMIELDGIESLEASPIFSRQVGGDVYNTLVACARLGSHAAFCTQVATDGFGKLLLKEFEEQQIDSRYVYKTPHGANGIYFTSKNDDGHHEFLYYRQDSAASQITPKQVTPQMIQQTKIMYASGITQAISSSARQTVLKAFQMAKQLGIITAYDPNYRLSLWKHQDIALEAMIEVLPFVDVILPSVEDLQGMYNFKGIHHMMEYFRLRGVPIVAIKEGAEGVTLSFKSRQIKIPPQTVDRVKDSIGAGDAFNGGFLHGLIQQRSLQECGRLGALVAAHSLQAMGPTQGLPRWSDIQEALQWATSPVSV